MILKRTIAAKFFQGFLVICITLTNFGCNGRGSSPATTTPTIPVSITPQPTLAPTPTPLPTSLQAVLDPGISLEKFPPSGVFIINFNFPMDPESSSDPLMIFPYVDGISSWDGSFKVLTYTPSDPLNEGASHTIFLDPNLRARMDITFTSVPTWNVNVDDGPDILELTPGTGTYADRKSLVQVTFDRPMDHDLTEKAFSVQPNLPVEFTWKDDMTLEILPQEARDIFTTYQFKLAGKDSPNPVMDADNVPMSEDYVWSYSQPLLEIDVNATEIDKLEVVFNYELDTTTTGQPFAIEPELEGKWQWETSSMATFTASEPIPVGQEFAVKITGQLADKAGQLVTQKDSFPFLALPPVTISYSDSKETDPSWIRTPLDASPLKIIFGVPMDHSSVENALSISPEIRGEFAWQSDPALPGQEVLEFYPGEWLIEFEPINVTLAPSLTTASGQKLLIEPLLLMFSSSGMDDYGPAFGFGSDLQVVDANGPRKIQFGSPGNQVIDFIAHGFILNDFVRLYASQHGDSDYFNDRSVLFPTADDPSVISWSQIAYAGGAQETILPDDLPLGLYILDLIPDGRISDRIFLILTENTLVVKHSGDDLFVWASDINTPGTNLAEAEIRLYSSRGEVLRQGLTDTDGVYRTTVPDGYIPMLVSARINGNAGSDIVISGLDSNFNNLFTRNDCDPCEQSNYLAYIYPERPIYEPGQEVNFKAIIREDHDLRYITPPTGSVITVNLRDYSNYLMETIELQTSKFGSIDGSFQLDENADEGAYEIEVLVNGESQSQLFYVQDYRKPDYQVKLSPRNPDLLNTIAVGDSILLDVDTSYIFGEPLANAVITTNFSLLAPPAGGLVGGGGLQTSFYFWESGNEDFRVTKKTRTDENGQAEIEFTPIRLETFNHGGSWIGLTNDESGQFVLEVTANDGSNQTVTAQFPFTIHRAAEKVSLDTHGYFQIPGQPFNISAQVVDLHGRPVANRKLRLSISRDQKIVVLSDSTLSNYSLLTGADGHANQEIILDAGYYDISLVGEDALGNEILQTHQLSVFNSNADWFERPGISIMPEEDEYAPYSTARFVIESIFSGPALLTFERGQVINSQVIELTAPLTVIESAVLPGYAPNVFVNVNAWQPAEYHPAGQNDSYLFDFSQPDSLFRLATTELKVRADLQELKVSIMPDQTSYAPNQSATVTIEVHDWQDKPVEAEVSLAVVNDSIFNLTDYLAPNFLQSFYGERPHTVSSFDSMSPIRTIGIRLDDRCGEGSGPEIFHIKSEFSDTAAWFPVLQTDKNGQVTVTFAMPSNLTKWRLSAKAITLDQKAGEAYTNITTIKDLIVHSNLPRVLTTGDHVELAAFVHNNGNRSLTVDVSLTGLGLGIQGDVSKTIVLAAGEVSQVTWPVDVHGTVPTEVTISARAENGLSDEMTLPLLLQPFSVPGKYTRVGEFSGELPLILPVPDIEPQTSKVTLQLSRSSGSSILNGLEYLNHVPYNSVEQVLSRALSNVVVSRAADLLGPEGQSVQQQVTPLIHSSLQSLNAMQDYGGWGWWFDDMYDDFQTAWVTYGLALIEDPGTVDPKKIQMSVDSLSSLLEDMDIRTRAFSLYSKTLSGKYDLYTIQQAAQVLLKGSLLDLDPFSQAALALTFNSLDDPEKAQFMLDALSAQVIQNGNLAYLPQPTSDGELDRKTMASSLRTTALALSAFMEIDPDNKLIPDLANYLISERKAQQGWGTSNETTFAILALSDYLRLQDPQTGETPYRVELNGKNLASGVLTPEKFDVEIDLPFDLLSGGLNTLLVKTDGGATIYYDLSMHYNLNSQQIEPAGPVKVTRQYLDPETDQPLELIEAGQLVKVQLVVSFPESSQYVVVEDHLPGSLEALNESMNWTSLGSPMFFENFGVNFRVLGYNNKIIFGDRVAFFITDLSETTKTITYMARANLTGEFVALPAEAYAMYDLDTWGCSGSDRVIVK